MSDRKQALLLWLQSVTAAQIHEINEIKNGSLLSQLLARVEGFQFTQTTSNPSDWKLGYSKLKEIYEQLINFLQKNTKSSLPAELSIMNLVEMSKGQSQQGLQTLLYLTFIVCIQSSIKSEVIPCIMKFPNHAQEELMIIIKQSTFQKEQENQRQNEINEYKVAISRLQFAYNNLVIENESLRNALFEDEERMHKNEDLVYKLQKKNQEMSRELLQKNEILQGQREELMNDKFGAINEELVEQLKKQLFEKQQSYGEEMLAWKEKIDLLSVELTESRKTNMELMDDQHRRNLYQSREDHSNCIAIEKHKAKINQILTLSKEATQKEMALKLQNIKLKNQTAELEFKYKKLSEELHKKNNEFMVSKDDAGKLKLQFFTRIRDQLKVKLSEFKIKDNHDNNFAEFLDNEHPEETPGNGVTSGK